MPSNNKNNNTKQHRAELTMCTFYYIKATLSGAFFSVRYYPDGEGRHYDGYVTDYRQLKDALHRHLGVRALKLSYVADGLQHFISSDAHLRRSVHNLPYQSVLLLNTFTHLGGEQAAGSSSRRHSRSSISAESPRDITTVRNTNIAPTRYTDGKTVLAHFAVHYADCHHCRCAPITGMRYVYKTHAAYSLCTKCYSELSRSEKRGWEKKVLPWDCNAPRAPLYPEDAVRREDTRHLQYLLTRFGFLKLSATSNVQGVYGTRTAAAVEKFRRKYHILGDDLRIYDKNTALVLAEVVHQLRAQGIKYI